MFAQTNSIKITIAVVLLLLSVVLVYASFGLVGLSGGFPDLSQRTQDLHLVKTVSADYYPLRFAVFFCVLLPNLFLLTTVLELLIAAYVPNTYVITLIQVRRLVQTAFLFSVLAALGTAYVVLFPDSLTLVQQIRQMVAMLGILFYAAVAMCLIVIGGVQYQERLLPRLVSKIMVTGGGINLILCIFAINPHLPITRYGLFYLPTYFVLIVLASYLYLVSRVQLQQNIAVDVDAVTVTPV